VLILLLGAEVTGGVTVDSEVEDSVKGQKINVSSSFWGKQVEKVNAQLLSVC